MKERWSWRLFFRWTCKLLLGVQDPEAHQHLLVSLDVGETLLLCQEWKIPVKIN